MVKNFSISVSDWIFETYLQGIKVNRSKFIEEMLVKGVEASTGEIDNVKARLISNVKELHEQEVKIARLIAEIERLKNKLRGKRRILSDAEKLTTAVVRKGLYS